MTDPRFLQEGFGPQLGHFVEECGEVLTAVGKTMRFGLDSVNPLLPPEEQETNRDFMRREMLDLRDVTSRLERTMDVMAGEVGERPMSAPEPMRQISEAVVDAVATLRRAHAELALAEARRKAARTELDAAIKAADAAAGSMMAAHEALSEAIQQ